MSIEPAPRTRVADLPGAYRRLPVIVWAGLVLGLVLPIIGFTIVGLDHNHDACVPLPANDLWPLPLATPVLCWIGLACSIAGARAAHLLDRRLCAGREEKTTSRWQGLVVAGMVMALFFGAALLYLVYAAEFLTVPVCVSEAAMVGGLR